MGEVLGEPHQLGSVEGLIYCNHYQPARPPCSRADHAMDLQLLEKTLSDRAEPSFRARQVWAWAARGAGGYEVMTDLPASLRDALTRELPFSSLALRDEAHSEDGTVKALFATVDERPLEAGADALPRYPSGHARPALDLRLLPVRVPADMHVLRDRHDALRP